MSTPKLVAAHLAKIIALKEGFYVTELQWRRQGKRLPRDWRPGHPITPAQKNNNPGNLRTWGTLPVVAGFAFFPSVEAGFTALESQVTRNVFLRGLTFLEFFAGQRDSTGKVLPGKYPGYAPAADKNDPVGYAQFVLNQSKLVWRTSKEQSLLRGLTIHSKMSSLINL